MFGWGAFSPEVRNGEPDWVLNADAGQGTAGALTQNATPVSISNVLQVGKDPVGGDGFAELRKAVLGVKC